MKRCRIIAVAPCLAHFCLAHFCLAAARMLNLHVCTPPCCWRAALWISAATIKIGQRQFRLCSHVIFLVLFYLPVGGAVCSAFALLPLGNLLAGAFHRRHFALHLRTALLLAAFAIFEGCLSFSLFALLLCGVAAGLFASRSFARRALLGARAARSASQRQSARGLRICRSR